MVGFALAGIASHFLPSREELDRESFIRGRKVSLLRRIVAFLYDGVIYAILAAVAFMLGANWFGDVPSWGYALLAVAYFTLCPTLLGGQTIGPQADQAAGSENERRQGRAGISTRCATLCL